MSSQSKIYGLIGKNLSHSFSMDFFNQKFIAEEIDASYINFEIDDIGDLMTILSEYPNINGLNVTSPYKEQVMSYMDELDDTALKVGAVNVIKIIKNADDGVLKMVGYNSDFMGFKNSLEPLLTPEMDRALILGTGGACKAVKAVVESLGIGVSLVSRKKSAQTITYEELTKQMVHEHKLIVNTTPLGTYPHSETYPPIPYRFITAAHLCYDLVYNPSETVFMKLSAEQGAKVKNGLEMLLLQAFESYRIWTER
ncbi:MAG: shikimate dehydrogenase [Muribaculaceae bacterium]|nr:shikimate dehydrogenase [Muribaculaceae bacterium]